MPIEEFKDAFPEIKTDKLQRVYRYFDARTDDLALTRRIAQDAKSDGAEFIEDLKVNDIETRDSFFVFTDKGEFTARNLVNVTGPWIDEVNQRYHLPSNYKTTKVSGIHLEIKGKLTPYPMILEAKDKRVFFLIPTESTTIIGTTERLEIAECDRINISEDDVEYLMANVNKFLKKPLNSSEVMNKWIGIRPLIKSRTNLSKISREYMFDLHTISGSRLMNIYGGKLTTCLSLSREAVKLLEDSNDRVFRS